MKKTLDLIETTRKAALEVFHRHNGGSALDDDLQVLSTATVSLCDVAKDLVEEVQRLRKDITVQ